jgi:predicted ArsR family transcriptional regulator
MSAEPAASLSTDLDATVGLSSPQQAILTHLKRNGPRSLAEIASWLGVSRVAALRHLRSLEEDGYLERSYRREGVGRPRAYFALTDRSTRLFPHNYTALSVAAFQFLERRLGRSAVVELLQERSHETAGRIRAAIPRGAPLLECVRRLAQLRSQEGYMAEVGARTSTGVELREHNCPVLAIADRYPEACEIERRMFESVLGGKVSTSHRVVAGDPVCRFWIRARKEGDQ